MVGLTACASPEADQERAHDDALGTAATLERMLVRRYGDEPTPPKIIARVYAWLANPPPEEHGALGFPTIEVLAHDRDSVDAVLYVFSEPKNTLAAGEPRYGRTCQRFAVVDEELRADEIDCPEGTPDEPAPGTSP